MNLPTIQSLPKIDFSGFFFFFTVYLWGKLVPLRAAKGEGGSDAGTVPYPARRIPLPSRAALPPRGAVEGVTTEVH